jgi:hypothetical protein
MLTSEPAKRTRAADRVIRVLVDGRIDGQDGIGRYTACLIRALRAQTGSAAAINVLSPTGTPRYSRAEGTELLDAARACQAEVIHVLDYRIPLEPTARQRPRTRHRRHPRLARLPTPSPSDASPGVPRLRLQRFQKPPHAARVARPPPPPCFCLTAGGLTVRAGCVGQWARASSVMRTMTRIMAIAR